MDDATTEQATTEQASRSGRRAAGWPYWLVAVGSLAWNAFGAVDYAMTRARNLAYLRSAMPGAAPPAVLAYIDGFPLWVQVGWGLGVWGAIAGSLLLLGRSRWAVPAFGVSLAGAVVSLGWQLAHPPTGFPSPGGIAKVMPVLIIVVAAALYHYARRRRAAGVLR